MTTDLNTLTRNFLLGEAVSPPGLQSYIQSLEELLKTLKPKTVREKRNIEVARQHLKEIRRHSRRLEEKVKILEEQIEVLEEGK